MWWDDLDYFFWVYGLKLFNVVFYLFWVCYKVLFVCWVFVYFLVGFGFVRLCFMNKILDDKKENWYYEWNMLLL